MTFIMNKEELQEILDKHKLYLQNDTEGEKADLRDAILSGADLRYANLSYADLSRANLSNATFIGADLSSANLSRANISGANLYNANLSGANLSGADLRGAYLYYADLRYAGLGYADLRNANLRNANLSKANLSNANLSNANLRGANFNNSILPDFQIKQEGYLKVYKKLNNGCIAELLIDYDAKRTACLKSNKCRCEKALVLSITNKDGVSLQKCVGWKYSYFIYEVGKYVVPDEYDDDIREECTNGIHFFMTREEAERW